MADQAATENTQAAGASPSRLRDLTDAEFTRTYGADRFTMSVLAGRYRYMVEHMCGNLLNNAFSLILRDWYDFAATISGPPSLDYPMSSVSNSLAVFFGTMDDGLRNAVEEYGPSRLRPGDVLICNDPYRTGTHVNDVLFARPVFVDGEIVSFVSLRAHQLDMGGVVPAGFSATKRDVYETGLVLGPQLLYSADEPVISTFNLILDNARLGALLVPDIKTIKENLGLGERLMHETIERYGLTAVHGAMRYSCDMSAEAMAIALESVPDGDYHGEATIDADGIDDSRDYRIVVDIAKRGNRVEIDLSGSSPQARTCINGSVLDTKTAIGIALKMLVDPGTPFTSGTYRQIDIVLPAGTILSATPPFGAVFLYWEATNVVVAAIFKALAPALGENAIGGDYGSLAIHNGNGTTADGVPWVTTAQCGGEHGPWAATRHGDGDSYEVIYLANNLDPATEAIEADVPVLVLRKEYVPDSGGAGFNRGGAAVLKDTFWLQPAEHWSSPLRCREAPGFGVHGGGDGTLPAVWLFEDPPGIDGGGQLTLDAAVYAGSTPIAGVLDPKTNELDPDGGEYFHFGRTPIWRTPARAAFRYRTAGAGGWGQAFERDPERVLRDVRNGYVSIEGAARDYGVAVVGDPELDPEGLRIDTDRTAQMRSAARADSV